MCKSQPSEHKPSSHPKPTKKETIGCQVFTTITSVLRAPISTLTVCLESKYFAQNQFFYIFSEICFKPLKLPHMPPNS